MNTNKQFIHYFTMNKKIAATPKNHRQLFYFSYHKIITPAIFLTKEQITNWLLAIVCLDIQS